MDKYVNKSISLKESRWNQLLFIQAKLNENNRSKVIDFALDGLAKQLGVGEFGLNAEKQPL